MKNVLLKILEFLKEVFKAKKEPNIVIVTPPKEEPVETKPSEVSKPDEVTKPKEEVKKMKFIARKTAPSATNKYYLKAGKGGYNRAMEIDKKTHSCLPNCVAMVHGRWLECRGLTDYSKYDKLPTGNAENYYTYTKDGYKRGNTPKVGAIICWRKGKAGNASDGAGHVAFVEEVKSNGDVVTSNSAYGKTKYYLKTYTKKSNYYMGSAYTFQGFIYNPEEFESESTPQTDITYKVVKGDTLGSIAKRYGTSVSKIVSDNKSKYPKISANYIQVGWKLIIKK